MRLDRTWIEGHIPHHGRMCLLDEVVQWDAQHIRCRSGTHRLPDHPLRSHGRLGIACGIEYAAQAMAVHGALAAGAAHDVTGGAAAGGAAAGGVAASGATGGAARGSPGGDTPAGGTARPEAGFLAALRDVWLHRVRLDDIETDLICEAALIAGDRGSALYEFALWSEAECLVSGRATVVFDANKWLSR